MQNPLSLLGALALGAALSVGVQASAQTAAATTDAAHDHAHDHAHGHSHAHDHADDPIAKGYFEDAQVQARTLADWQGDWQSVYPYLTSGALDPVMAHKAQHGDKSAAEYRSYYEAGYKTDVDRIEIKDDRVTLHRGDKAVSGTYADDGHEVLTYPKGNRGVRYVFRKTEGDAEAPAFIQFSDHRIAPEKSDHYHLYWGEDRAALLDEITHWPTYYPAGLTAEQVVAEMMAH